MRQRHSSLVPDGHIDVLVNFPDHPVNLYQIRQWYGPLEWLAEHYSVAILCHNPDTAATIRQETSLRALLTPTFSDISAVEHTITPDVVLYPNQNYNNYQILGYSHAVHAFICHGESDKTYMTSNWLKGFDYFLVAGEASRQRLRRNLLNYDVDARTKAIGRPQIDIHLTPAVDKDPARTTVIYAPTWEGGRTSMSYGSVASHGVAIVRALLADSRYRLIYRPHPRTGIRSQQHLRVDAGIRAAIDAALAAHPDSGHFVDVSPFGWQLDVADVMVTDISAVAYDWLTTAKPLIMTRPAESAVPIADDGLVGAMDLLPVDRANDISAVIQHDLTDTDQRERRERLADFYYGDRSPGASLHRFLNAIESIVTQARRWNNGSVRASGTTELPRATLRSALRNAWATIATQFTGGRREAEGERAVNLSLSARSTDVVFNVMGSPGQAQYTIDWLRVFESIDVRTDISVAVVCGDYETFRLLSRHTGLRVLFCEGTVRAELVMDGLDPMVTVHATQSKNTLRETTYRNTVHAYLGDAGTTGWINNCLRVFDALILPTEADLAVLENAVRPLSPQSRVYTLTAGGAPSAQVSGLYPVVSELCDFARNERDLRERRRRGDR